MSEGMIHRFGEFEVDEALYQVRRSGVEIRLRRRSFEVLVHLLRNPDRVISKDELLERVWQRKAVSESSFANCVSEIRAALGARRDRGRMVQTVYGRGYRFVAEVDSPPSEPCSLASAGGPEGGARSPRRVFVGRERELVRLTRALEEVAARSGRVVLLLGEVGSGKTRLLDRFLEHAARQRARVLVARCGRDGAANLGSWVDALRRQLDDREIQGVSEATGVDAQEIDALDLESLESVVDVSSASSTRVQATRVRLFRALRDVPRRAVASRALRDRDRRSSRCGPRIADAPGLGRKPGSDHEHRSYTNKSSTAGQRIALTSHLPSLRSNNDRSFILAGREARDPVKALR